MLRGTLQRFPASELLQFMATSKKTGVLRVFDDEESKFVAFEAGRLVYAVHQRPLPHLSELLVRPDDTASPGARTSPGQRSGWDDIVNRALARRRLLPFQRSDEARRAARALARESRARLSTLLVARGKFTDEQLAEALAPRNLPDPVLEEILRANELVPDSELAELAATQRAGETLYECVTEQGLVDDEVIAIAVEGASDELVAETLILRGLLPRAHARECLNQLQSLRGQSTTQLRLGEYLVATGQVSQSQFERALVEQLHQDKKIGEIFIDHGIVTPMEILKALDDIENLRVDFGPLYPLRRKLGESHLFSSKDFSEAVEEHARTRCPLSAILEAGEKVTERVFHEAVKEVLIDELGDILIWRHAQFEFLDEVSLSDILPASEFAEVSPERFDLQMLLLEAHSFVDELRRSDRRSLSMLSVLIPTDLSSEAPDGVGATRSIRVLRNFDGRKSLRQIRRVLPGNRFSHLRLFADLLERGLVRPLSRREAFLRAKNAAARGDHQVAITLLRHALRFPGETPTNTKIQQAIRESQQALDHRSWVEKLGDSMRLRAARHGSPSRPTLVRRSVPERPPFLIALEEALIRNRFARAVWSFQNRVLRPLDRWVPPTLSVPRPMALILLGLVAISFTLLVRREVASPGLQTALAVARDDTASLELASVRHRVEDLGVAVDAAPLALGRTVFVAARDGHVRAIDAVDLLEQEDSEAPLPLLWELELGEYGDLLAPPVAIDGDIIVAGVRGRLARLRATGELVWNRSFARLEPLPAAVVPDDRGEPAAIIVAERDVLHAMDPADGSELSRWRAEGVPVVPLEVAAGRVFAGTAERVVSCWSVAEGQLLWRHEHGEPLRSLVEAQGVIAVASTRSHLAERGTLTGLDAGTGEEIWKLEDVELLPDAMPPQDPEFFPALQEGQEWIEVTPQTGAVDRRQRIEPLLSFGRPLVVGETILFTTERGYIGMLDRGGEVRWRSESPVGEVTAWGRGEEFSAGVTADGRVIIVAR